MKFQYASDLHLEFRDNYTHLMELEPLKPVAPYLILAGDIDIIGLEEVLRYDFFKFLSEHRKKFSSFLATMNTIKKAMFQSRLILITTYFRMLDI